MKKTFRKESKEKRKGITLIALVITIIVLLILAGISISMLSGDNSILRKATDAKKATETASTKEQIQLQVLGSFGKYADLELDKLKENLESIGATVTGNSFPVTATLNNQSYTIDSDGNVTKAGPTIEVGEVKVVTNANGTGEDVTANSKTEGTDTLYIALSPTITGGSITSVTYNDGTNNTTITPQNGIYVLEISKNGNYNFTINATAEGETISTPYTKTVDKYELWGGIEIGDYVTYVPPKDNGVVKSYSLVAGASGYTADQTLTQQYNIWRVLNKNQDGTLDIMPAFKDSGVTYTNIYFSDAKGWNNAPYILDDMCSYLYADEKHGITARSIDYEDITSHMIDGVEGTSSSNSTGLKKISKYQSEQVGALSKGTYIDSIDPSTNTVTYKGGRTSHPTSYFDVKDNESDPYYDTEDNPIDINSSTNGRVATADKPATLPVKYTYYYGTISSSDFENSNAHSVIFGTGTIYWLASRCVRCDSIFTCFDLRIVDSSDLSGSDVFISYDRASSNPYQVSPVVTLGSNVQVTKCTGANSKSNRHTVVVP